VLNGESAVAEAYDEGRVTERLLIGAHVLGLGGGIAWFGDDDLQTRAKQFLGIPEERTARAVVTIGYPRSIKDPRPNPATPGRRPASELVSYDRMGNRRAG
jgi:nitroreductase